MSGSQIPKKQRFALLSVPALAGRVLAAALVFNFAFLAFNSSAAVLNVTSVTETDSGLTVNRVTVKIFDGPTGTNKLVTTGIGSRTPFTVATDDVVEITAPREVYRNLYLQDITDSVQSDPQKIQDEAQERFTAIGISVNDEPQTGDPTAFRFRMPANNVEVIVRWRHEYALLIQHDFTDTQSQEKDAAGRPWAGPLTSEAEGNPDPAAKKHWIKRGDTEIAFIAGQVLDFSRPGFAIRYVPVGYRASGPPNRNTTDVDDLAKRRAGEPLIEETFPWQVGQAPPQRQQVPQFTMYGPGVISFVWRLQFGVEVNVDSPARAALPKVFEVQNGTDLEIGAGQGTFWFNPGIRVKVATAANESTPESPALVGWVSGDGFFFGSSADIDSSDGTLLSGFPAVRTNGSPVAIWRPVLSLNPALGAEYRGLEIPQLVRAARVMWRYGVQQIRLNVLIGQHVFENDPASAAAFNIQPDQILQISVQPDQPTPENMQVAPSDMAIWDAVASRLYPLVPGSFRAVWRPGAEATDQVDVIVTVNYPDPAHYPHIANTPPVALDPDPADTFVFKALKYTENSAAVNGSKHFTATQSGKTVLLFAELQPDGRGIPREFLRVRVVDTGVWDDGITAGTAIIGRNITDPLDRANLGTGFVFDHTQLARYNPFIYDPTKLTGLAAKDIYDMQALRSDDAPKIVIHHDKLPGPVIPVNLFPEEDQQLVVVWYDDPTENDELLWPHAARYYDPRWPETTDEGLGRIVIASQHGSESVASGGGDQIVDSFSPSSSPPTTYDPTRFQQVQIYVQNDPTLPGYNPNEEHALIAPSLRFAHVSPRPPAAYALRDNDLNVYNDAFPDETSQPENYTSHPFVLVQFFDTLAQQFKMRLYHVAKEDRNIPGYRLANQTLFASCPTPSSSLQVVAPLALRAEVVLNCDISAEPRTLQLEPHVVMEAGEPVIPFYPLGVVSGASLCPETFGVNIKGQAVYWEDHRHSSWAVSGGSNAWFTVSTYYPLSPDFWWQPGKPGFLRELSESTGVVTRAIQPQAGDCLAFLPDNIDALKEDLAIDAVVPTNDDFLRDITPASILYKSDWPANPPVLKAGETLTFPGGEFRADHPLRSIPAEDGAIQTVQTPGLPGIVAFASAQVVFDSLNPLSAPNQWTNTWTARAVQALDKRSVPLPFPHFPPNLSPATSRTRVKQGKYLFNHLPASLQKRVRYDPLGGKLELFGLLNDKEIGDPTLTASPRAVYVLEPNILTAEEEKALIDLAPENDLWQRVVTLLGRLSRNPSLIDTDNTALPPFSDPLYRSQLMAYWTNYYRDIAQLPIGSVVPRSNDIANIDPTYLVGLEPTILRDVNGVPITIPDPVVPGIERTLTDPKIPAPLRAFGPGLALVPNPAFLDPDAGLPEISWVTVVENNDPTLGGSPITLHVIQVSQKDRYRGAIKTIASDNVFDENLMLRHTGDFGANAGELFFEWWYRPDDGSLNVPPPDLLQPGQTNPWKLFPDPTGERGRGRYQIILKGNPNAPETLLADSWWFVRYRHRNDDTQGTDWNVDQRDSTGTIVAPRVNFTWAGAGNSDPLNDFDGDGLPDYRAQLAQGWIKRVLDAVNPYEARIREFDGDNPATRASMLAQFGARFEGPVALNPDKNVIENVGLIELYETILRRGRELSIDLTRPVATPAIFNALQLASTRISDFYTILGNEAYTDARDPTIGFGSDLPDDLSGAYPGYGSLAPAVFCFQNQMSSLIQEELALLRGVDDFFARPVYNRLFWNFTKGEGEAAYAVSYNISDINVDGFVDEDDAMILFPQGHGDAWGHYLTALRNQYELINHKFFNWVSRSEFYNLQDIVIKVDFLDERKFAQTAAAKAKVGAEIVSLTYRDKYVEDPTAQWQGYIDSNKDRAWGVQDWARRGGQGAYFDWVTANALLPSKHPNQRLEGIQRVDREVNSDIAVISANLNAIQTTVDQANKGHNPLGITRNGLVFDIDPTFLEVGSTAQIGTRAVQGLLHFDQIYERAIKMLQNAVAVFNNANQVHNLLRKVGNTEIDFRNSVFQQDLSYRNQLIKIFGRPYEGTIGPGRVYPAGYNGPDLLLFMYVDVREVNQNTVPGPAASFADFSTDGTLTSGAVYDAFVNGQGGLKIRDETSNDIRLLFSPTFALDTNVNLTPFLAQSLFYNVNYTDLLSPKVPLDNLTQLMPITAAGFTFQAPRDWGSRLAVGELQLLINRMIQQEAQIASAIGVWDALQGAITRELRIINAKLQTSDNIRNRNEALIRAKYILDTVLRGIEGVIAIIQSSEEVVELTQESIKQGIPLNLPTGGLSISPGDALGPARGALNLSKVAFKTTFSASEIVLQISKFIQQSAFDIAEKEVGLANDTDERTLARKELLVELENLVGDEPVRRIEIFKEIEALRELGDQYRALVDEGTRLLDERMAFNKRVAAQTQRNRYQDMTFRVSQNHALQTYREAFDLAARYAYLAAKAYDYETNFDPADPGSPHTILADIVAARTLGQFDGEPRIGAGGIAEALAKLKENYEVLKGQLGFNNPEIEIGKMSLRTELFRILPKTPPVEVTSVDYLTNTTANTTTVTTVYTIDAESATQPETNAIYGFPSPGMTSDDVWHETLQNAVVHDLWAVPEYRALCRPFSSEADGSGAHVPEPGIVIRFGTQIIAGRNFFGKPLSGGDHAYDPAHFSTKIQSVGVWFSDYLSGDVLNDLPATPRVYLVPVGADIMSVPTRNDPNFVRVWKVVDQRIPVPLPATTANLDNGNWIPLLDSLDGRFGEPRKYATFRAYHDGGTEVNDDEVVLDTRLVGRSIWNTQWMLIIPGRMLNNDPNEGLRRFIDQVSDIRLVFRTYGVSGG